jgi:hypothetical protein
MIVESLKRMVRDPGDAKMRSIEVCPEAGVRQSVTSR